MLDSKEKEKRLSGIKQFAERYAEVLSSTVAVDMFYCSAAIALPPGIDLDIFRLCMESGYIHSAGKSLYIRNIKKARIHDFRNSLNSHLDTLNPKDLPVPFVVYAHEDFTAYDRVSRDQISKGIETTKLYLEKMSMGAYRLAEIVEQMRGEMQGKLDIPSAGPYGEVHKFENPKKTIWLIEVHKFENPKKTIWLITERSLSKSNPTNQGMERYYVCYEQEVKSEK